MYTITAATGRLGRLVIDELLRRGVPATDIVATARNIEAAADLAEKGIEIRHADYDEPDTLIAALEGADRLLLIPSASFGQRAAQAKAVVDAAVKTGVSLIAYRGFVNSTTSTLVLADEHREVEAHILHTGIPRVFLRNGAYTEVYSGELGDLEPALANGAIIGSAGDGKISGTNRSDLAIAAASVLLAQNPKEAYELGGDAFTMTELAAEISKQLGRPLSYIDMPVEEYAAALTSRGLPEGFANILADTSLAVSRGDWYTDSTDLVELLGRRPQPMADTVRSTLAALGHKRSE